MKNKEIIKKKQKYHCIMAIGVFIIFLISFIGFLFAKMFVLAIIELVIVLIVVNYGEKLWKLDFANEEKEEK